MCVDGKNELKCDGGQGRALLTLFMSDVFVDKMISLAQSFFEQVVSVFSIFLAWKVDSVTGELSSCCSCASHHDD